MGGGFANVGAALGNASGLPGLPPQIAAPLAIAGTAIGLIAGKPESDLVGNPLLGNPYKPGAILWGVGTLKSDLEWRLRRLSRGTARGERALPNEFDAAALTPLGQAPKGSIRKTWEDRDRDLHRFARVPFGNQTEDPAAWTIGGGFLHHPMETTVELENGNGPRDDVAAEAFGFVDGSGAHFFETGDSLELVRGRIKRATFTYGFANIGPPNFWHDEIVSAKRVESHVKAVQKRWALWNETGRAPAFDYIRKAQTLESFKFEAWQDRARRNDDGSPADKHRSVRRWLKGRKQRVRAAWEALQESILEQNAAAAAAWLDWKAELDAIAAKNAVLAQVRSEFEFAWEQAIASGGFDPGRALDLPDLIRELAPGLPDRQGALQRELELVDVEGQTRQIADAGRVRDSRFSSTAAAGGAAGLVPDRQAGFSSSADGNLALVAAGAALLLLLTLR